MTLEDIINSIEEIIKSKDLNYTLILLRKVEPCSFKAYSKYTHILWSKSKNNSKRIIFKYQLIARVTSESERISTVNWTDKFFLKEIMNIIINEDIEDFLNGKLYTD